MQYRANEGPPRYIEHSSRSGAWCGPLIPASTHPRAAELACPCICIACGDFCEDIDAATVAMVHECDERLGLG